MLHNAVVLYRRTITFSYIVSTNHKSRLRIPSFPPTACSNAELTKRHHRPPRTVYDISRRETFENMSEVWLREVDMYSTVRVVVQPLTPA